MRIKIKQNNRLVNTIKNVFLILLVTNGAWATESSSVATETNTKTKFDCVIEPSEVVDIGSAVPGLIDVIYVLRNDFVKKGTIIAELESSVEKATVALTQERAGQNTSIRLRQENAAFALRTQERNKPLSVKSNISEHGMDKYNTETRIAKLQVRQEIENRRIAELEYLRAKAIQQRRVIKSPIDGVVVERFKYAGEYVEDNPIIRIAQINPLYVKVLIPLELHHRIKQGMRADVVADVPGSKPYIAKVDSVDRVADAASGTYGVRLILSNEGYKIPAGVRCHLTFLPGTPD